MRGQLRDAAQGGRQEETEADRAQGAVRSAAQETVYRVEKLVRDRRKGKVKTYEGRWESSAVEPRGTRPEHPVSATGTGPAISPSGGESMRIKVRDSAYSSSPVNISRTDPGQSGPPQIKTKDACVQRQGIDARLGKQRSTANDAAPSGGQWAQPLEQGRQKFIQERQTAAVRRAKDQRRGERTAAARQRDQVGIPLRRTSTRSGQPGDKPAKRAAQETVSGGKRQVKAARSGVKVTGQASRQTVKTADRTARATVKTAERGAKTAQKTAQATVKTTRQAVQAMRGTKRAANAVGKSAAKVAVSTQRWARTIIRAAMVPLSASGGAVIAIVLVICMVGAIAKSPLGIFFSGGGGGNQIGQNISAVVREINQEYEAQIEALKTGTTHDELSLSGSRALWSEILAVYAVKATSDPTNGLEVVTIDDTKKELLKQVFWDMNELSSFTSAVPGEDDEEDTTTLHITVTAKTADEIADV